MGCPTMPLKSSRSMYIVSLEPLGFVDPYDYTPTLFRIVKSNLTHTFQQSLQPSWWGSKWWAATRFLKQNYIKLMPAARFLKFYEWPPTFFFLKFYWQMSQIIKCILIYLRIYNINAQWKPSNMTSESKLFHIISCDWIWFSQGQTIVLECHVEAWPR